MADSGKKLPLAIWQRFPLFIIKYATPKKLMNFIHAYFNYLAGTKSIKNMPVFYKVEISRNCKVDCRYCFDKRMEVYYPLEDYKSHIDKFKDYIFLVSLYDIGEPLLNDNAIEYIRYASQNNIGSVISTSLSVEKDDKYWEDLINSGLTKIIVAIDGITQKVYNTYRRNGNFELVMKNFATILALKKKLNSKINIEWQMIDFEWNRGEQKEAAKMAKELGCNIFRIIRETKIPRSKYKKSGYIRQKRCLLSYLIFIVTADKTVRPCFKIYDEPVEVGSLNYNTFDEIWNNEEMLKIRNDKEISSRLGCKTCKE